MSASQHLIEIGTLCPSVPLLSF